MTDNRATELLCKLLDKHGIAWKKRRGYIRWSKQTKYGVTHYQAWPCFDGTITLTVRDEYELTPGQAIAATLGSGTLTADDVLNAVYKHGARWQSIADELNARAERTCEARRHGRLAGMASFVCFSCSVCHYGWHTSEYDEPFKYCPNCGRRVIDVRQGE